MTLDPGCYFRGLCTASLTPNGPVGRRDRATRWASSGGALGFVTQVGGVA